MSQENVELVRSMYAAWKRGDWTSVDWAHPEMEMVFADGPAPASWTGSASVSDGWRDFLSAWEEFRVEAEDGSTWGSVATSVVGEARPESDGLVRKLTM